MKNTVLNETMNLTIPEGFTEITQEEVQAMTMCKGPAPMWNITYTDHRQLVQGRMDPVPPVQCKGYDQVHPEQLQVQIEGKISVWRNLQRYHRNNSGWQ